MDSDAAAEVEWNVDGAGLYRLRLYDTNGWDGVCIL